eukprot:COSAG01_NODE_25804_length_732_cov_2.082148_1_plen_134_part_10
MHGGVSHCGPRPIHHIRQCLPLVGRAGTQSEARTSSSLGEAAHRSAAVVRHGAAAAACGSRGVEAGQQASRPAATRPGPPCCAEWLPLPRPPARIKAKSKKAKQSKAKQSKAKPQSKAPTSQQQFVPVCVKNEV